MNCISISNITLDDFSTSGSCVVHAAFPIETSSRRSHQLDTSSRLGCARYGPVRLKRTVTHIMMTSQLGMRGRLQQWTLLDTG